LPVTVTFTGPVVAEPLAEKVRVLEPLVVGFGLKSAVTPLGNAEAENVTLPLNPFDGLTLMVVFPALPWVMVTPVGDAERLKSGLGADPGQPLTRFAALTVPIPVAKSQPTPVRNAGE
jgi:hypothetical protein